MTMRANVRPSRFREERGIALITAILVMMLMSALLVGFSTVVMSDQRYRIIDRDRVRAFYAAHSGLEKLNLELRNLFFADVAPSDTQIEALAQDPPDIPDVTFVTTGDAAYRVTREVDPQPSQIATGPYAGLMALKTTYRLHSTARTAGNGESHLTREVETVAIPVFQFGMFSEVDLSFSAADNFDFGGRVHTNGNLFLAQGGGSSDVLWLRDKVTAVGEIVRQRLSNGASIDASGSTRTVRMARAPGSFRDLGRDEGSVTDGIGSSLNSIWPTLSLSTYNGYIRNGRTGARRLDLPLVTTGGANIDLVKRPAVNEDTTNPTLLASRYFNNVSLRILLSDTAADILSLPTVTSTPPVQLDGDWRTSPPSGYTVDASHPPIALSPGAQSVKVIATSGSGNNRTISVGTNNVPEYFRPSNTGPAGPGTLSIQGFAWMPTCTGREPSRFTGCTGIMASIPSGRTITGSVNGVPVQTTTYGTSSGSTINVVTDGALPFAPTMFWVNDTVIYCTTVTPSAFTGCTPGASSGQFVTTGALSAPGVGLVGGFLKIEMQDTNETWHDVTMEILSHGIAATNQDGKPCGAPNPNAIIILQRLRDNAEPGTGTCSYANSENWADYWPNVLFDAREAVYRDDAPGSDPLLGGVMHYVAINVANLANWFAGNGPYAGSSGPNAITDNGYSVYFSDRRNNRNAAGQETGEYGWEDVVNPSSSDGTPNGVLDQGEDFNENGTLETYGQFPSYNGVYQAVPPGALAPLTTSEARPTATIQPSAAMVNRAVLFRRALKLVNGDRQALVDSGIPGLTVAAENPVYIQGNYNFDAASYADPDLPHLATSVVTDAITLLSDNWSDVDSLMSPYDNDGRPRSSGNYYRTAIISGKGPIFPRPSGAGATFGTDGGAHSFLRFLEGGFGTIYYRGSMATFYYNRQAVSPFKCCGGVVYDVPTRDYRFDIDFLDPAKLPPLTPVFRDLNSLGFTQETRPGR